MWGLLPQPSGARHNYLEIAEFSFYSALLIQLRAPLPPPVPSSAPSQHKGAYGGRRRKGAKKKLKKNKKIQLWKESRCFWDLEWSALAMGLAWDFQKSKYQSPCLLAVSLLTLQYGFQMEQGTEPKLSRIGSENGGFFFYFFFSGEGADCCFQRRNPPAPCEPEK